MTRLARLLPGYVTPTGLPREESILHVTGGGKKPYAALCRFCAWRKNFTTEDARHEGAYSHIESHVPEEKRLTND